MKNRFVFDTNVLVSAILFPESLPAKALDVAVSEGDLYRSYVTELELVRTLTKPKFVKYITESEIELAVESYLRASKVVEVIFHIQACRDPKDNKFLDVAVSSVADCLITGDDDLLTLHPFRGVDILTPRDFCERYKEA
jgi:putative PIN family toxin of toxin-antitoxin system